MELVQINLDSKPDDFGIASDSKANANIKMQVEYYSVIGFQPPWVGYVATVGGVPVGLGAFKGVPKNNKVEIAYFTFPEKEGTGLGTRICKSLVDIAQTKDPRIEITARTLPEKNASTRILEKNGFTFSSVVLDPEDGDVWEWSKS